ncbi:MAG TPA: TadE/TadG family type IV pilus assembly protein [Candidatus Limnocylindrales bacterium]|nr:TadE/TadG family type IV pilus assembly protein [Candidatus Limnocylindrales bacterium]
MRRAADRTRPRAIRGRKALRAKDRGAHTMEFVIVAGPLLLVTFMVIQAALVFYSRSLALAAATQGANVARAYGSSLEAGEDKAERFLDAAGQGLRGPEVVVKTNSARTEVTVTVTGRAPSIVPFMTFDIQQTARGPVERFVPS